VLRVVSCFLFRLLQHIKSTHSHTHFRKTIIYYNFYSIILCPVCTYMYMYSRPIFFISASHGAAEERPERLRARPRGAPSQAHSREIESTHTMCKVWTCHTQTHTNKRRRILEKLDPSSSRRAYKRLWPPRMEDDTTRSMCQACRNSVTRSRIRSSEYAAPFQAAAERRRI
jgi:hypothetical protein